ncbi:hypothetical protein [Rhodoferax sp. PAMC 29310]|uniref:hypothetical protein n=1 Tax=Rhodoferax sp. PAMC 29310 TaxID=2822760 RepID=UPI001B325922|nr:hypothetical protein [Rhodoferax sp. PAMC 29310]
MNSNNAGQFDRPNELRRKLFRGVSGGVGVLLAVQAKTALGGSCASPSAILSGNTSPRPGTGDTCSGGWSPGFWKVPQHATDWGLAGATYPTFKKTVVTCTSSGMKGLTLKDINTPGTLLSAAGFGTGGAPAGTGIWAVIAFPGSFTGGQLLRHLAAAWLNAGRFTSASNRYPLSRSQIIAMWDATKSGGLYMPNGASVSQGWSATQVISYIEGMYDINSGDPALCTTP